MAAARLGPMPGTDTSFSGDSLITRRVSSPKRCTMAWAMEGPTPLISPQPRKRSISSARVGRITSYSWAFSWRPKLGCSVHSPRTSTRSPSFR